MTTRMLQDNYKVETNELSEYLDIEGELKNPGTPEAKLNVNIDIHKELPSNLEIIVKAEKLNRKGVYEETPLVIKKNYCGYIRMDKIIYPVISKSGSLPKACPIKPGMYKIKDFNLNGNELPIAVPAGSYKVSFCYKLGDKILVSVWSGRSVNV